MRKLRLTEDSLKVAAEWNAQAGEEHRRRLAALLRSLEDGSWDAPRWYPTMYTSEPETISLGLDTYIKVYLRIFRDEAEGMDEFADVFAIENEEQI